MKLNITVFNKPEVLAGFFVEVMKIAEFFRCRMAIATGTEGGASLDPLELWMMKQGKTTELEIVATGPDSQKALEAVRSLMVHRYTEGVYQLN